MADEKTIYKMKTPSGDPVRVEEAWKDANGELLTEKVNKADAQTITGLKTFSTLPQSNATPSDDKDLATKKYSDDLWATRKAQEEKCYQALKTVTKDFTRTDPVYVRIGEDGEPEIHYIMSGVSDATEYFKHMKLGNASLYCHGCGKFTNFESTFRALTASKLSIDSMASCKMLSNTFLGIGGDDGRVKIEMPSDTAGITNITTAFSYGPLRALPFFDTSGLTSCSDFILLYFLAEIPAYDFSNVTSFGSSFTRNVNTITAFHAYGMRASFNLSVIALKHDAILEVFNNLGTVDATAGITLTLGSDKLALMSDEEKAIATGKGWVLA